MASRDDLTLAERDSLNQAAKDFELTPADTAALAKGFGVTPRLIAYWFAPEGQGGRNLVTKRMAEKTFDELTDKERRRLELARLVAGGLTVETKSRFSGEEKQRKEIKIYDDLYEVIKRVDNVQSGLADTFLGAASSGHVVTFHAAGVYEVRDFYQRPQGDELNEFYDDDDDIPNDEPPGDGEDWLNESDDDLDDDF